MFNNLSAEFIAALPTALILALEMAPSHMVATLTESDVEAIRDNRVNMNDMLDIAYKRHIADIGDAEDAERIDTYRRNVRKVCGDSAPIFYGAKSLGAKSHGKATVCTPGSGHGRYAAERLYRVPRV